MPPRPNYRQYVVPVVGLLWGTCMTLAALISRVQDLTFQSNPYSLRSYVLLGLPGFIMAAGWLVFRLVK